LKLKRFSITLVFVGDGLRGIGAHLVRRILRHPAGTRFQGSGEVLVGDLKVYKKTSIDMRLKVRLTPAVVNREPW